MSGNASAGGRGGASSGKSEPLYDADAPYIVESYQGDGNADDELDAEGQPPAYSYTHNPGLSSSAAPTRSWDDAARAKPNPINPTGGHQANQPHAYVDMEAGGIPGGFPGSMPAPLNTSITGYATAHGWDLGKLCLACYVLPPFTSAIVLIWETQNVRAGSADLECLTYPRISLVSTPTSQVSVVPWPFAVFGSCGVFLD